MKFSQTLPILKIWLVIFKKKIFFLIFPKVVLFKLWSVNLYQAMNSELLVHNYIIQYMITENKKYAFKTSLENWYHNHIQS